MHSAASFSAHLQHAKSWRIINEDWRFCHFSHRFTDFTEIVVTQITGADIPAVNTRGISKHTVNQLLFTHL